MPGSLWTEKCGTCLAPPAGSTGDSCWYPGDTPSLSSLHCGTCSSVPRSQVESAIVAPDGQTAVLVASIQEAARLIDGRDADHNDSYKSTYKARYDLKRAGAGWKITGGTILR